MKFSDLKELIQLVSESNITSFEFEENGTKITLGKENKNIVVSEVKPQVVEVKKEKVEQIAEAASYVEEKEENLKEVPSPMVGTFYNAPSPEEPPFVEVGTRVKKGDVICIIEAMKIMNEIESDVDGIVREIAVTNEEMVQYGQCLIKIEAC